MLARLATLAALGALAFSVLPMAASATSFGTPGAVYTAGGIGGTGGYYAKSGSTLTLTVTTDSAARCVDVAGVTPFQTSSSAKTTWTFSVPAAGQGAADGVQSTLVTIGERDNGKNCTMRTATTTASYILDNTGPTVTAAVSPVPNAAGWNNSDAAVTWTAHDGTGVGGGTVTGNTTVSTDTAGQTVTGSATDALGNHGPSSSVLVRRDTAGPTIAGSRTPSANANGWNNGPVTATFSCSDPLSLIAACAADGTSPQAAARTLTGDGADQSVGGTATDNAGNTSHATVGGINIDTTAPTVSASATLPGGAPYTPGTWTNYDVTVSYDCHDALSGVDTCDAPTTLTGEGADRSATGSAVDKAGNTASTTVSHIDIDSTAPTTVATAPTSQWNNTAVTVTLTAHDALSGVQATRYQVNGGDTQTGTTVSFDAEGTYTLTYWSVDNAGNTEDAHTVTVTIDKTPPTITHTLSPAPNGNGWNNSAVTVTFSCGDDGGSGVASCGPDQTVRSEGAGQSVTGTATDRAGNSATDPATVNVDTTAPTITGSAGGAATPTTYGWYNEDVTVSFDCADPQADNGTDGSGIDTCTAAHTLGEGADQSVTGTARDAAGNTSSDTVSGISVDTTAPTLTGTPSTESWARDDVTVTWTCTDDGSGVVAVPDPSTVTGEGDTLSATATCTDRAGNSTTRTVTGIRIDRAAPHTTATVERPHDSGWYADSVDITLSTQDSLSGVATTYYSVDGGDAHTYHDTFAFSAGGRHTIRYWSVDNAGNTEDSAGNALSMWIDDAAPTVTGGRTPEANGYGWNNTPVTVSFACDDTQSGVAACAGPVTLDQEGAKQQATGEATDGVGKTASATVDGINIDMTAPTLTANRPAPNAAGWYSGNVTVTWQGADGLSGIDPTTQPTDSVITGEGRGLGAGPQTIADKAGNLSDPASVDGVNIDRHGPAILGTPTTQPNAAGWYSGSVTVDFTCIDPQLADGTDGSGVATCPTSQVLDGDGADQSVTSGRASDVAGNTTAGTAVPGISIDSTPPVSTSDIRCVKSNGYCTGSTADVVLTATDQTGLSGVKEIHYRINDGAAHVAAGDTTTVTVPLDGSGTGTVTYWAIDNAGNVEATNGAALSWDNIAPTVTHIVNPEPNAAGWNNGDTTVHFHATDDDAGSGVDPSSVTPDRTVTDETAGTVVTGTARDTAGNLGSDTVTVRVDKTAPTITGSVADGTRGAGGWFVGPVTVHFTCSDPNAGNGTAGSGVPATACPDDVVLAANGANQSVTRSVTDRAGNTASTTVSGIGIDQEKPTITSVSVADGAVYKAIPASPTCTASDDVSGVDSCAVQTTPTSTPGTYTFTATARDKAGNTANLTGTYQVNLYAFSGFLQPINDPSLQPGSAMSIVKTGSTVPVKFQLRDANGNVVQARTTPQWLTPAKGSLTTASVNETGTGDTATADGYFRWDPTAQQYIYTWQTKGLTANYTYRIGVRLDDGQTHTVTVGLK